MIISRLQLEISFIKQTLSEVISQGRSGSVVKDAGVRYGGLWFELWSVFISTFFVHLFYPMVTALLKYLDPVILHLLSFCLNNSRNENYNYFIIWPSISEHPVIQTEATVLLEYFIYMCMFY